MERFERWGFGNAGGELAILTGLVEVGGGLLLRLLDVLVRPVAIGLIGTMVVAPVTAGRVDGGQNMWLPIGAWRC